MYAPRVLHLILLLIASIFISSCQGKGSLTYVIDDTGSMTEDIDHVKDSTDSITKIVFEAVGSQIENMVLVTFNDPYSTLETVTTDRDIFKSNITAIRAGNKYGNPDCAEMAMSGLDLALKSSLPGSFIYVFTDASAKDYYKSNDIIKLCQEKQSQIVFVMTDYCESLDEVSFKVYYEIAKACSGFVCLLKSRDIPSIFDPIKDAIVNKNAVLTSRTIPAYQIQNISFVVYDHTEYIRVTASGINVRLSVNGPKHMWKIHEEKLTWLDNIKVLKLINLVPGTYTVTVSGRSETTVYVVGKTDFSFQHGFSESDSVNTINDTSAQPIADSMTHLFISVSDPQKTEKLILAQILDMNENVINDLSITELKDNLYRTSALRVPLVMFKVAVIGKSTHTNENIRHIAKFPISPKPGNKVPKITGDTEKIVRVGTNSVIKCTVTEGKPRPDITWQFMAKGGSKFIPLPGSDSVKTISNVSEKLAGYYKCIAHNIAGNDEHITILTVQDPPSITSDSTTIYKSVEGKDSVLKIPCSATGIPTPTITWTVKNQPVLPNKRLSIEDGALVIRNPTVTDTQAYVCEARNVVGSTRASFLVEIHQVPVISGETLKTVRAGSTSNIKCAITKGVPAPAITWQFMAKGDSKFIPLKGFNNELRILYVRDKHAGRYKCVAHNIVGEDEHITTLVVEFAPVIRVNHSKTYEGLEGDVALKIPCEAIGVPPPIISWSIDNNPITTNSHFSILPDGALVIKDPKKSDSGHYKCKATNIIGDISETFDANVKTELDDFGAIEIVNINQLEQSTFRLECGAPEQSVRWFIDGEVNLTGNYFDLNYLDDSYYGNYTCRVSDMHGAYTKTFRVRVGTPPVFSFKHIGTIFDWKGSKKDVLDCAVDNSDETEVQWTHNGKLLNERSVRLSVDSQWGHYTCNVSNVFGSVQKSFDVISTLCLIPKNMKKYGAMPLILSTESTWPTVSHTADYLKVKPGSRIKFSCPDNKGEQNNLKEFPTLNEVTATCDKQDIFIINGKSYKLSDLSCDHEIVPTIIKKNVQCATNPSELIVVGFNVTQFLEVYEVCYDTSVHMAHYTRVVMSENRRGGNFINSWYQHPDIESGSNEGAYTCKTSTSNCCYSKGQLISAQVFSDGPSQNTTFIDSLNAIPIWRPCNKSDSPWEDLQYLVSSQHDLYSDFVVWSGTHQLQKKDGYIIPRYLWKVINFDNETSMAIVYVNGPAVTKADLLCDISCDSPVSDLTNLGDNVYCCQKQEFLKAIGLQGTKI